jgi:two-component system nitrogen regulation response regulator NtrX
MAAPTNGRVLIYGANGTGKELVARSVHALSRRSAGPFVEVNCAAIPEELIESELLGYARGAFTGAVADRQGKFEVADGGTIFLDEIADMSLKTQAKVLRVLQEQVVEPLGGRTGARVNVRVVAATNKDLAVEIQSGRFRDDLFFRLNVIPIFVPPLADRREDIPVRADHFMREFAHEYGHRVKALDDGALAIVRAHSWPGNVRELRNVLERLAIMVPGETIGQADLGFLVGNALSDRAVPDAGDRLSLHVARDRFERDYIVRALAAQRGNISRAADALGVERSNLYRKMRALGIIAARRTETTHRSHPVSPRAPDPA